MNVRITTLIIQVLDDQPIRDWVFRIVALIVLALAVRTMPALLSAEQPIILLSFGIAVPIISVVLVAILIFQTARK